MFQVTVYIKKNKMWPALALVVVGLFSVAEGQLTTAELTIFRGRGVVIKDNGESYTFSHGGLPDHETTSTNNNPITEQNHEFEIPKTPKFADEPGCLYLGPIGMAINGVAIYNPFTLLGTDAVVNEQFDSCSGHPDPTGSYHYHEIPKCLYTGAEDQLLGIAMDGYPIYGSKTAGGKVLTTADLDKCHGQERDGKYEYRATADFPYFLGCYKGVTIEGGDNREGMEGGERTPPPEGGERTPPPEGGMGPGGDGGRGGMGPGGAMDWDSCYALVGCENPGLQKGEEACEEASAGNNVVAGMGVVLAALVLKWFV